MKVKERHFEIVKLLERETYISFKDLSQALKTPEITIRRDIALLTSQDNEYQQALGGIRKIEITSLDSRLQINTKQKLKIANRFKSQVKRGMSLCVDAGSTVYYCLEAIMGIEDLTIVTSEPNHLRILTKFKNIKIHLLGGEVDPRTHQVLGPLAEEMINKFQPDIGLVACSAIDNKGFLKCGLVGENSIKKALIKNSKLSILVCDSEKMKADAFYQFAHIDDLDLVIMENTSTTSLSNKLKKLSK